MEHELKIWPQYYCRVKDGSKTFEVRDNDRGFQSGDTVKLMEFDPDMVSPIDDTIPKGYTGSPPLLFKIGYILVLSSNKVVFSILPIAKAKKASKPKAS